MSNTLLIETGQTSANILTATYSSPGGGEFNLSDIRFIKVPGNFNFTTNASDIVQVARALVEASEVNPSDIEALFIYASGLDHPSSEAPAVETFREAGIRPDCKAYAKNDGLTGLVALSTLQDRCGSVNVGTGQNSHFLGNNLYRQKGGSGYLLADGEYGGVAIGKQVFEKSLYEMACLIADHKNYGSEWELVQKHGGYLLKVIFQYVASEAGIKREDLVFSRDLFHHLYTADNQQTIKHTNFFKKLSEVVGNCAGFNEWEYNNFENDIEWSRKAFSSTSSKLVDYVTDPLMQTGFDANEGLLTLTGTIPEKSYIFRSTFISGILEKFPNTSFHTFRTHQHMLKASLSGSVNLIQSDGGPIFRNS